MKNTLIDVMYRCAGNYKTHSQVVLAGVDRIDEISVLIQRHHLDEVAIPELLGLSDCYAYDPCTGEGFEDELDHPFVSIEVSETCSSPSGSTTQKSFIALCITHDHEGYMLPFQR